MFTYNGFHIWHNGNNWCVQEGYSILARCKTMGAAKAWVTKHIKKL